MQQQPTDPVQDTSPSPPKKKKRGCCFGCSMLIVLVIFALLGYVGYLFYKSRPHKSAVEKEYNSIPEYIENR